MRKILALLFVLAAAVAASGCGASGGDDAAESPTTSPSTSTTEGPAAEEPSDSSPSTDGSDDAAMGTADEYADAFIVSLSEGSIDDGELVIARSAAECVAPEHVEIMTVEKLHEAGVTLEDAADTSFDPSVVGLDAAQADAMIDAFEGCGVDIVTATVELLAYGLDPEVQACIMDNVDRELVYELLTASFSTGDADAEFDALTADLEPVCELPAN